MADPDLDKENNKRPSIEQQIIGQRFVIPQLKIPQLNLSGQQQPQLSTAEALAAQEAQHRAADEHNKRLLNEIKRRREQQTTTTTSSSTLGSGFTIPKLRTASGETLEEPQLNIPLLNKLRSQNNSLEQVKQVELGVKILKIASETEKETRTSPLIDLTTTVIAVPKGAPPREAASQQMRRKATQIAEHFDIPFIGCDGLRGLLTKKQPATRHNDRESQPAIVAIVEKSSIIGMFMDRSVGYPQPRQPQLKYAATQLERQHLKLSQRSDYGCNLKRFEFNTPSPDERIKEALLKSRRITRT